MDRATDMTTTWLASTKGNGLAEPQPVGWPRGCRLASVREPISRDTASSGLPVPGEIGLSEVDLVAATGTTRPPPLRRHVEDGEALRSNMAPYRQ